MSVSLALIYSEKEEDPMAAAEARAMKQSS
jgi:hypothetical protein